MTRTRAVALGLFTLATLTRSSSAKPLPLEAPSPDRGVIGVRIKVIPPARIGWGSAVAVYFVRVVEDSDRFGAEGVINSNYTKGGNVYLLNAKPGRYVAVGCEFQLGMAGDTAKAVFPKADILQTEVEVQAGSFVFMGDITSQSSTKVQESDEAQAHYLRMIAPAAANKGFMARALSGAFVYTAGFKTLVRDKTATTGFWSEATEEHFKNDPAWSSRIARRSSAPVGGVLGSTSTGGTAATSSAATDANLSGDEFLSAVCVEVNAVKARANGQPKEAAEIARLVCQTVMTDWGAQGCRENPGQAPCRKRLASLDGSLKSSGSSMLFAAAQAGQASICSVMLAMGSDPNVATSSGKTPVAIATESDHSEIVEMFAKGSAPAPSDGAVAASAPSTLADSRTAMTTGDGGTGLRLQGNIPAKRLDGHTYTSPDGGFELTLPPLITPGAKAEERQVDEGMGVFFADDFGNLYYVLRTDNTQLNFDLEKIAAGYTIGETLREKRIVPTARGSELRLAGIMPGGSPIARETKVKQETTLQKLDLHQAMSLFLAESHIYEVAAGVTATHQEPDAEMVARAKERLDAFLGGLRIKAAVNP